MVLPGGLAEHEKCAHAVTSGPIRVFGFFRDTITDTIAGLGPALRRRYCIDQV